MEGAGESARSGGPQLQQEQGAQGPRGCAVDAWRAAAGHQPEPERHLLGRMRSLQEADKTECMVRTSVLWS